MTAVALDLKVDNGKLLLALRRSPANLQRNMGQAISRIVADIGRTARRTAPKATSQLTNSIQARRITPLHGVVRTGTAYADPVEHGSGLQGPNPGARAGFPPVTDLLQWVRVKQIVPRDPRMDEFDLAYVIARSIAQKGTPPQPYLGPAVDAHRADAVRRIDAALDKTLEAMT